MSKSPYIFALVTLVTASLGFESQAAPINIAVDLDTTTTLSGVSTPFLTQPGFQSWNITGWSDPVFFTSPFATQGVSFVLWAAQPTAPNTVDNVRHGTRNRRFEGGGGGGPDNDLLQELAFADGGLGTFLMLRISNLPVGDYRMTTWHYDGSVPALTPPNHMQIEVGDQQPDKIAGATTLIVDHFPLSTTPQTFVLHVTSTSLVKEVVFRNDNPATGPDANSTHRARLNGFTLVSVPEPSGAALVVAGLFAMVRRRA